MEDFANVFIALNDLERDGVIQKYAIAGATAFLFYAEPVRTYDLDVFVFLPPQQGTIISMEPLYAELTKRGYSFDAEHVLIHGAPVQFIPTYNALSDESVDEAVMHDYAGVQVRVISAEHIIALSLQTGGKHRRSRVEALLEEDEDVLDKDKLNAILAAHNLKLNESEK